MRGVGHVGGIAGRAGVGGLAPFCPRSDGPQSWTGGQRFEEGIWKSVARMVQKNAIQVGTWNFLDSMYLTSAIHTIHLFQI